MRRRLVAVLLFALVLVFVVVSVAMAQGTVPPGPTPTPPEIPEAGSLVLLGTGLVGLAGYAGLRWRARK